MASPQVAGAAALFRSDLPSASCYLTKSAILATTLEVSASQTGWPFNTRDAYGFSCNSTATGYGIGPVIPPYDAMQFGSRFTTPQTSVGGGQVFGSASLTPDFNLSQFIIDTRDEIFQMPDDYTFTGHGIAFRRWSPHDLPSGALLRSELLANAEDRHDERTEGDLWTVGSILVVESGQCPSSIPAYRSSCYDRWFSLPP